MFSISAIILSLTIVIAVSAQTTGKKPWITCYYFASNGAYRQGDGFYNTEKLPEDQCTHFIYASIGIDNTSWILKIQDELVDVDFKGFKNFTDNRNINTNAKYLISLGIPTVPLISFAEMISMKPRRDSFISSIVEFLNYYNFDGINIDWDLTYIKDNSHRNNYLYFLEEMKRAFNNENKNWILSMQGVISNDAINKVIFIPEMCNLVDAVLLQTYELRPFWVNYMADVHSPLYKRPHDTGIFTNININDGVQIWVNGGCPPEKLIIGIPFYGKSVTLENPVHHNIGAKVKGPGKSGRFTNIVGAMAYYEICSNLQESKSPWTRAWDNVGKVPYSYKDDQWVGYEDVESISLKIDWIKQKGYGGVYVFSVDTDDFNGMCGSLYPLINAVRAIMEGYHVPISNVTTTQRPVWLRGPTTTTTSTATSTSTSTSTSTTMPRN